MKYNHQKIERKWQEVWQRAKLYTTKDSVKGRENFYTLVEFPYPSGNLHVGHWYAFSVPDIYARYMRMRGKNVLYPIGFDAFGLPAENAALKRGLNPRKWTLGNIEYMKKQMQAMGASFDWSREVVTCEPEYYKWNQWIFTQFFKKGLAYQAETAVNWCPSCKTVLANEQAVEGKCERCGTLVEKRKMKQWQLRITDYAEKLLSGLDKLDWPEEIKESQRNWIGKSEGAEIGFPISKSEFQIKIFTTRPDTIFGATYLVLAPEHPLVQDHLFNSPPHEEGKGEVMEYIEKAKKKTEIQRAAVEKEKTGVELKGVKAINPATGEEIPVWIADYVLMGYGTGAIMAVPAHDERDFAFAKKYRLPIKKVIERGPSDSLVENAEAIAAEVVEDLQIENECWSGGGKLVNSGDYTGLDFQDAIVRIAHDLGTKKTQYKLRDWVISRQRYWGTPIPIIHCPDCGSQAVLEKDLPVELPEIKDYKPRDDGKSPLAKAEKWAKVKCPKCGGQAERETDTMDTFVDSAWYFLRYTDPKNKKTFASREKMKKWLPVNRYSGGAEHTTMHLLYSRFWIKAMHDLGLVDWDEPYLERMNRGIILGPDGQKMSKSRGNVVDPDKLVKELGADTVRMYLAFIGPYNEVGSYPWNPKGIMGVRRFLERVWRIGNSKIKNQKSKLQFKIQKCVKKVGSDIETFKFNTAISAMMVLVNEFSASSNNISQKQFETFLKLLAPFAPHLAEELWHKLGHRKSVHLEPWPEYDEELLKVAKVKVAVQVNGKLRATLELAGEAEEAGAVAAARKDPNVAKHLEDKEVKKVVYVKGKIINFVVT